MQFALIDENDNILRVQEFDQRPDDPTGKGWRWEEFVAPAPSTVPQFVTMRQARLALLQTGMLAQVNAAVAAADETTKITWEFSIEVRRNNVLISTLAAALNLTDAQLDNLFTLATTL